MNKLCNVLQKILYVLSMASVCLFFVCTSVQVCSRTFGFEANFTQELANASLTWCCFVGSAAMIYSDDHFKFSALTEKLRGKMLFLDDLVVRFFVLVFNFIVAYYGVELVLQFWNWKMTTMPISRSWGWLCLPIFGISGVIFSINGIIHRLQHPQMEQIESALDKAMREAKEANQ